VIKSEAQVLSPAGTFLEGGCSAEIELGHSFPAVQEQGPEHSPERLGEEGLINSSDARTALTSLSDRGIE
jgi:hypothetical protein